MNKSTDNLKTASFDRPIRIVLRICKLPLWIGLLMNAFSFALIIFSNSEYYYQQAFSPQALDALLVMFFYATFYFTALIGLPVAILIALLYLQLRITKAKNLNIKSHFRLIFMTTIFIIGFVSYIFFN